MLKVIIAEDDKAMRLVLRRVLAGMPEVEITGEADNGRQLVSMVEQAQPDVIFMDIDMPEMNGIEAAYEIFDINPGIFIIFATAFDSYTHEAFQVYAFDYIIKPFNLERIRQTVNRIKELKAQREGIYTEHRATGVSKVNRKLAIENKDNCKLINIADIIMITRQDRKTAVYTAQSCVTTYEPMHIIEDKIKDNIFFRCHKGFIINKDMVLEILPWGKKTYLVKLANIRETALMTAQKAKEFRQRFCR